MADEEPIDELAERRARKSSRTQPIFVDCSFAPSPYVQFAFGGWLPGPLILPPVTSWRRISSLVDQFGRRIEDDVPF